MFVTYLSHRKQTNSSSLFILSLSFSAWKLLKAKLRFTLVLERVLSAWCFTSYFLFFTVMSTSVTFSVLNGVQLLFYPSQPHLRAVIGWRKHTHSPPRNILTKPKHQHTGRGWSSADTVTTTHVQRPKSDDWAGFRAHSHLVLLSRTVSTNVPLPLFRWRTLTSLQSNCAWARLSCLMYGVTRIFTCIFFIF